MIADLTAVADHLQLLADLLAGQPASSGGLISEAASWLAAAQAAADAASAPGTGSAESFGTGRRDIALGRMDGHRDEPGIGIGANPGTGANPGVGPGAMSGGAADWRQTWLVEDRDLYATGPSVQPVTGGG
jgi:hypothetical protein